jgi:hypothetical protein
MLIKQANVHEGHWGIHFEFALLGGNIPFPPPNTPIPSPEHNLVPAAILPIIKILIMKFDKPSALTLDAAQVNPPKSNDS